MLQIRILFVKK